MAPCGLRGNATVLPEPNKLFDETHGSRKTDGLVILRAGERNPHRRTKKGELRWEADTLVAWLAVALGYTIYTSRTLVKLSKFVSATHSRLAHVILLPFLSPPVVAYSVTARISSPLASSCSFVVSSCRFYIFINFPVFS